MSKEIHHVATNDFFLKFRMRSQVNDVGRLSARRTVHVNILSGYVMVVPFSVNGMPIYMICY